MKNTASLRRGLEKVRRLCEKDREDLALGEIERLLEAWPDLPALLVKRAQLIQLQEEEDEEPTLEEAKRSLKRAAELDPESPDVLVELGSYLLTVECKAQPAAEHFARAAELCRGILKDALLGQADAFVELGREAEAVACLAQAILCTQNGRLSRVEQDILERLESLRPAKV